MQVQTCAAQGSATVHARRKRGPEGVGGGKEAARARCVHMVFFNFTFYFVDYYLKGPARLTTPTTGRAHEGQMTIGPHARVLTNELVRRWVPEDDMGDARGRDDTLGQETRGRASD
jgi:hypothetical protein